MPTYQWEGKTKKGESRKGTIEAENEAEAQDKLRAQNIVVSKVRRSFKGFEIKLPFGRGVPQKSLVVFSRQLATMIDAGLPLVQALDLLGTQEPNRNLKTVILDVKNSVESGTTFADALRKHPKIFNELFINLIAAGEVGGILDTILNRLAEYIEKAARLKSKVKGALVYPIAILVVAVIITSIMLIKVVPEFAKMFSSFGDRPLPKMTQIVMTISDFAIAWSPLIALAIIGFVIAYIAIYRTPPGKLFFDTIYTRMPLFGGLVVKSAIAKFTRTLGTLISSGVPILDALEIVAKTAGNKVYENGIFYVREKIAEGQSIAEPLLEIKIFPNMVVQMIAVGESTGAMDTMLQKIADFYEEEVDQAVDALTSLLEPIMMVFLGGIVAFLMLSMYLPIFEMAGAAGASKG